MTDHLPRLRTLTIREARDVWATVRPLLRDHLPLARGISEQAELLSREGLPPYAVAQRLALVLFEMAEQEVAPFDTETELSRVVRLLRQRIATGSWEPEPDVDHLALNAAAGPAAAFNPWARHEALHSQAVSVIEPDGRIVDSRENHVQHRPSAVMEGGVHFRMGD